MYHEHDIVTGTTLLYLYQYVYTVLPRPLPHPLLHPLPRAGMTAGSGRKTHSEAGSKPALVGGPPVQGLYDQSKSPVRTSTPLYISMCIYMYTVYCTVHQYVYIHVHCILYSTSVCVYTCTCTLYTVLYISMCIYMYMYIVYCTLHQYVYIHVHVHVHCILYSTSVYVYTHCILYQYERSKLSGRIKATLSRYIDVTVFIRPDTVYF